MSTGTPAGGSNPVFHRTRANTLLPIHVCTPMGANPTINRRLYERVAHFFVEHLRAR